MRFTWLSNAPWAPTGYGIQTALFLPRFEQAGHQVACIAFYGHEGTPINWNGIQVYGRGFAPWGLDVWDAHTRHFGANLTISLTDAWVLDPAYLVSGVRWIPWFPVDHDPLPPPVAAKVSKAYRRMVFSKHALKSVQDAGMDAYYVPHGVDTKEYRQVEQAPARAALGLPMDKFIVGMVAANKGTPSRKAFTQQIEAFAQFHRRHPDSTLYLHTNKGQNGEDQGINLVEFIQHTGLSHSTLGRPDTDPNAAVLFCDQYIYLLGFPTDYMAHIYSAMDIHMLVSMGEGFGIPTLEAQACGTPVIVGGWTASKELCFAGQQVDVNKAERYWSPLGAWQYLPRPGAIWAALEEEYRRPSKRAKAREGAMAYDADLVLQQYWQPILLELEQDLGLWEGEVTYERS